MDCGLLVELSELSFWRHPFTAEDPLVSKWCNAKFLQICCNDVTTHWMAWAWANVHFWVNYSFKTNHPSAHLQVKVCYAFWVEVVNSIQDLLEELRGLLLSQWLLLSQEIKQLPSRHQLQNQNHIGFVLKDVMEGDDVAVLDLSKDVHLSLDLLSAHTSSAGWQPSLLDKLSGIFCSVALFFTFAYNSKLPTGKQGKMIHRENRNEKEEIMSLHIEDRDME